MSNRKQADFSKIKAQIDAKMAARADQGKPINTWTGGVLLDLSDHQHSPQAVWNAIEAWAAKSPSVMATKIESGEGWLEIRMSYRARGASAHDAWRKLERLLKLDPAGKTIWIDTDDYDDRPTTPEQFLGSLG